jgi:hypothetical protein
VEAFEAVFMHDFDETSGSILNSAYTIPMEESQEVRGRYMKREEKVDKATYHQYFSTNFYNERISSVTSNWF